MSKVKISQEGISIAAKWWADYLFRKELTIPNPSQKTKTIFTLSQEAKSMQEYPPTETELQAFEGALQEHIRVACERKSEVLLIMYIGIPDKESNSSEVLIQACKNANIKCPDLGERTNVLMRIGYGNIVLNATVYQATLYNAN